MKSIKTLRKVKDLLEKLDCTYFNAYQSALKDVGGVELLEEVKNILKEEEYIITVPNYLYNEDYMKKHNLEKLRKVNNINDLSKYIYDGEGEQLKEIIGCNGYDCFIVIDKKDTLEFIPLENPNDVILGEFDKGFGYEYIIKR